MSVCDLLCDLFGLFTLSGDFVGIGLVQNGLPVFPCDYRPVQRWHGHRLAVGYVEYGH